MIEEIEITPIDDRDQTSSMTHQTLSGMFWLLSGSGVQAILRMAVMIVMARLLMPADFGLVAGALVLIDFIEVFSDLGIGLVIVQRHELEERHIRTGFTVSALLGLTLGAAIWIAAPWAAQLLRMEGLTTILRVMALVFPIDSLALVPAALLQRNLQFRTLARISVAGYVLGYGLVGVSMAVAGFGVWALVAAYLTQTIFVSAASLLAKPHPKRLCLDWPTLKEMTYMGAGFSVAQVFNYIALKGDNAVVGRWLGVSALGVYTRAYGLMTMSVTLFGTAFDRVMFASLAKLQHEKSRTALAFRRSAGLMALLVLPMSAVMFFTAPELIQVLLGPKWREVVVPFQILALGMIFRTGYKVSASVARATGAVYHSAWRQGVYALMVIAGGLIGQRWGVPGVALGVLGALFAFFMLMAQLSIGLTSIRWRDYLAAHVPAISLALVVGAESWASLTITRGMLLSPIAVLAIALGSVALTLLIFLSVSPRLVLGDDGVWLLCRVAERVPGRYLMIARWKKNLERALVSAPGN
jgi:PST family polysaccharide transporter